MVTDMRDTRKTTPLDTTKMDTDWTKRDTTSDTIGYKTYDTPFGPVTVYTKDQPGPKGPKAGTTKTVWKDPPPRRMKLKKKHRKS
jgi:hypothetical protein